MITQGKKYTTADQTCACDADIGFTVSLADLTTCVCNTNIGYYLDSGVPGASWACKCNEGATFNFATKTDSDYSLSKFFII